MISVLTRWWSACVNLLTASPIPGRQQGDESRWHLFALSAFAIAQPLYDRLTERPGFLVDLRVGTIELVFLVGSLSIVLPTLLVLLIAGIGRITRRGALFVHRLIVAVLLTLILLPLLKLAPIYPPSLVLSLAVVLAVAGAWCYAASRPCRLLVSWGGLGVIVFPAWFLIRISSAMAHVEAAVEPAKNFQPCPVVVLVFDELCGKALITPEGDIDVHRFPNFAALSRDATWFRNASSVHQATENAVPAILSGKYSRALTAPLPSDRPNNLFNILHHRAGYELAAFEPVTRLATDRFSQSPEPVSSTRTRLSFLADTLARVYLFHIVPSHWGRFLPVIPRTWFGLSSMDNVDRTQQRGIFRYAWGDQRPEQVEHFLHCINQQGLRQQGRNSHGRPTLYFLHLLLPHVPWCYLPDGRTYAEDGENWQMLDLTTHGGTDQWGEDEWEVTQCQQRYLLQLMYLDRELGRIVRRLKETGIYDRSLLVVTADHGVSFRANQPRRRAVPENVDELLSVPLLIKRPDQTRGGADDRPVESIDILPSILDVVGLRLTQPIDGTSVFDAAQVARTQFTYTVGMDQHKVDVDRLRNSSVSRELRERFGAGDDPLNIYRIGPLPNLIGERVANLPMHEAPQLELKLLRFQTQMDLQGTPQVPCWIEGTVQPDQLVEGADTLLAVAVNGTVQAVTRTFRQAGYLHHWSAFVPDSAFQIGYNEIQFYELKLIDGKPHVTLCQAVEIPSEPDMTR